MSSAVHSVSFPSVTIAWQPDCSADGSEEQQLLRPLHPLPPELPLPDPVPVPEAQLG
jgi:hypothetical protein